MYKEYQEALVTSYFQSGYSSVAKLYFLHELEGRVSWSLKYFGCKAISGLFHCYRSPEYTIE